MRSIRRGLAQVFGPVVYVSHNPNMFILSPFQILCGANQTLPIGSATSRAQDLEGNVVEREHLLQGPDVLFLCLALAHKVNYLLLGASYCAAASALSAVSWSRWDCPESALHVGA